MDYIKSWFKIKQYTRRRYIVSGIVAFAVALISLVIHQCNPLLALGWGAAMFIALLCPIGFTDNLPYFFRFVILYGFTTLLFIMMQGTISCGIANLSGLLFFMNVMIMYGLTSVMWLITNSMKASMLTVTGFTYIIAIVDHIVVQSRSYEIQFSDIGSIGTAMDVAGQYAFTLSNVTKIMVMLGIVFIGLISATEFPKSKRSIKQAVYAASPIVLSLICGFIVFNQAYSGALGITDKYWKYRGSELNGFWVSTIYSASATRIVEPQGYGETDITIEAVLNKDDIPETSVKEEEDVETAPVTDGEKKPHVIVIMNETFCDVNNIAEYFGNTMETNVPVLPFYDSLSDEDSNVIKGHAIASVHGGNTANSEFEFLTGMSMAFLPRSTVAYSFYLNESNAFGVVDSFNAAGYTTIGIHPEDETNWKRNSIYDYYGFDQTYFIDDFADLTSEDMYRGHVSDKAVYNKIIDIYEGLEDGETMFTFAVTMQNHGGYTTSGFEPTVWLTDANKHSINEYLSTINNSDAALQYLIEYFEEQDEEVIICFFGDHQPALSYFGNHYFNLTDESDEGERLAQYVIPYMYWSNSDIDCNVKEVTSLNFLSGYLLDMAGVEKTDFLSFVNQLNDEIPALNAAGWLDNDMNFNPISYTSKDLPQNLQLYSSLQYNALFDTENRLTALFRAGSDEELAASEGEEALKTAETNVDGETSDSEDVTVTENVVTEPVETSIASSDLAA